MHFFFFHETIWPCYIWSLGDYLVAWKCMKFGFRQFVTLKLKIILPLDWGVLIKGPVWYSISVAESQFFNIPTHVKPKKGPNFEMSCYISTNNLKLRDLKFQWKIKEKGYRIIWRKKYKRKWNMNTKIGH